MVGHMKLGYLVLEVSRPERWRRFAEQMLGLAPSGANADGSLGYQLDEAAQRLVLSPGPRDDLAALGLELSGAAALAALAGRLELAGTRVHEASDALRRARRVQQLLHFEDPEGTRLEAFVAPARAAHPFHSPAFAGGFKTGALGMGHAALVVRDLEGMERFYTQVLGFAVSERLEARAGPLTVRGSFLHCNRRHHSLALFALPLRKRLHHFMLEVQEVRDVGLAFERAGRLGVPLSLELGQHPDPDGTFSFYGMTPSGFDFEVGAGGKELDPLTWTARHASVTSAWGHRPTARLKLRTARALLAHRLRGAGPRG